jgi:hypothetical protein
MTKTPRNEHMARRQAQVGSYRTVAKEFGVGKSTIGRAVSTKIGPKPKKVPGLDLKTGFTRIGSADD